MSAFVGRRADFTQFQLRFFAEFEVRFTFPEPFGELVVSYVFPESFLSASCRSFKLLVLVV